MTRKAIFLDVDGTLVNDLGVIPDSARTAIRAARANGHLVFLCTGRSLPELFDDITSVGFDGVIAAAGGYVEYDEQVLVHTNVAVADVLRAVEFFEAHDVQYFLEANSGLYASTGLPDRLRELLFGGVTDETILAELERGFGPFIEQMIVGQPLRRDDINKISFLSGGATLDEVRAELADAFTVIPATVPMFGPRLRRAVHPRRAQGRRHRGAPGAPGHRRRRHDGLRRRAQRPRDARARRDRRGDGQRRPGAEGDRRRRHRLPGRGRAAHQLHQVRADLRIDMPKTRYDAVVFDQDGTLINTFHPALTAYSAAVGRPITMAELTPVAHLGAARNLISALLGHPASDRQNDVFHDALARAIREIEPYPGIPALLADLRAAGVRVAVATNSDRRSAGVVLGAHDLAGLFDVVVTVDEAGGPKPDPAMIHLALASLEVSPDRGVFVGDSQADMIAARSAGLVAALAGWGHEAPSVPAEAIDVVVGSPADVLALVHSEP